MVNGSAPDNRVRARPVAAALAWWFAAVLGLIFVIGIPLDAPAAGSPPSAHEKNIAALFKAGNYPAVVQQFQALPKDATPSKEFLRLSFQSFVKLGRGEEALPLYPRLKPEGKPDDLTLLMPLALSLITSRVRDPKEHVRIAAYTVLAELGLPDTGPLLEDGLLNSSVLVRARAAEAIGRAGLAAKSGALKRAINDEAPSVRIAAMNALGDARVMEIKARLIEIGRTEEGPEAIFAYAALYKMGQTDMLIDITNAATLPDAEVRMAAIGVLGRLKRPASLALLSQAVYDPNPSVRAFAAGALGEFGSPGGVAPLTHALGDEMAMVRGVAAGSLGKLGLKENRPLLQALTRDPSLQVRASATESLLRLGDSSVLLLAADLARNPDPSIRGSAAQALSATSDKEALSVLEALLKDQQPLPRLMAAKALGKVSGPVVPILLKGLQDSDEAVRIAAAGSLLQQTARAARTSRRP